MTLKKIISNAYVPVATSALFFILGIACILITLHAPVKDFGNYYYGSRLLLDGKFNPGMYTDIAYFNEQIAAYGEIDFFENYIPVPPFSAIFYAPFCFFKSLHAKLIFNVLSLLLFCFSFKRLLSFLNIESKAVYLIPFVFAYPLLNNILQGQSYLLIAALLAEIFIASEQKKAVYPAFLTAFIIILKIFPLFLLLYFLLKKKYKVLGYCLLFILLFFGISFLFIDTSLLTYYVLHILPRLFNNDIVGPYYYGNQSLYTFLLNLFSYDGLSNPHPVTHMPWLVALFESIFSAFILATLFELRTKNNFILFAVTTFSIILFSRYSTTYSMLFLIPLALMIASEQKKMLLQLALLLGLFIFMTFPAGMFSNSLFAFKFLRLWGLVTLFIILLYNTGVRLNYKLFLVIFIPLFAFRYFTFSILPATYFSTQSTKGILYDIDIHDNSITLKSTLGEKTVEETTTFTAAKLKTDTTLMIIENRIYYKGRVLCDSKDNKLKPFIYNDTAVVFMSDLNQAVRFYKLRTIPLVK